MTQFYLIMNGLDFIHSKQQGWAKRKGLNLVAGGTKPDKKSYLSSIADNLFEPLSKRSLASYESADGNETEDSNTRLAKMKALHSSSAIVVNLFQYWQGKDIYPILKALKMVPAQLSPLNWEIKFEEQFVISEDKPNSPANIDVVIHAPQSVIGIESKFAEPYYRDKHKGLEKSYVEKPSFWDGLPYLHELAKEISPNNNRFQCLDAAQLIKHVLGLTKGCMNKNGGNSHLRQDFRLLYLWYDVVGTKGVEHRKEIEQFAEIAKKDNVKFSHITYQEVIANLAEEFYDGNETYCNYLTDRYL